ncbi:hypothetical protein FDX19_15595 [Citrobacter sp. wls619]|uniref:hypothetical protein n=1 Tax=Citrobacter sp. wls619 TaxID=2576432 RepID=UPI0010C9DBEF|nr:hypothetical protein [Citrobacter sp. wls619]TKV08260.1 hypothetical protein FDX19_15595 [Citrobacter sp. wls619]
MGLITGNGSSTSSSTSHTTSWLADALEPIVNDFISSYSGINYENSVVSGLTPAEQAALERAGSGKAIDTGTSIAKGGASLVDEALGEIQGLLEGNGKTQFMSGVTGLYNGASDFMDTQDSAIEDSVYSEMGAEFGNTAQSTMASTAVSGSSSADSARNAVLSSGANSMVTQESDLAMKILKGSVGLTTGAMSGEVGLLDQLLSAGGSIFQTGTKMAASGEKNQFNAGLFEQWFNQQTANNNRKNDMINNNMDLIDFSVLMQEILPAAGIDTTTDTTSTTNGTGGGLW